jgi:ATP-dependent DNA helicase RecQ
MFEPEAGIRVKSKIEYLIYRELREAREARRLTFAYEEELELPLDGRPVTVKPDFAIRCNGRIFYWEHLGMLDRADYSRNWRKKRAGYETKGLAGFLLTTDDLGGVRQDRIRRVIDDMTVGQLSGDGSSEFSAHHYSL